MHEKGFLSPLWDFILKPQTKGQRKVSLFPDEFRRDSLLSAKQELAQTIMLGSCPYHGALWVGWDDGWQQCLPDMASVAKGTQWWVAKPQCLHYTAAEAALFGDIRGAAPLLLLPHSHGDVLGTLDQDSRDNSVHLETLFSLWDSRTEGREGCLTCLQQAVFWGNAKLQLSI